MPQIQITPENIAQFLTHAQPVYPTRDEIIGGATPTHKPEVVALVHTWKKEHWMPTDRHGTPNEKMESIFSMIRQVATIYQKPVTTQFNPNQPSHYEPGGQTINLNKPSIITALHELAHHLFGSSETKACRWSVWLFKKTFPTAFSRLVWDGHCLIRPEEQNHNPQTQD